MKVVLRVAYLEFYIVPRTGVFTTDARLNTGLRLQRRPELDGNLEREFHQNRAQLDAHRVPSRSYDVRASGSVFADFLRNRSSQSNLIGQNGKPNRSVAFRVCGGLLRCRSVAFRALAQSLDMLGVPRTKWKI